MSGMKKLMAVLVVGAALFALSGCSRAISLMVGEWAGTVTIQDAEVRVNYKLDTPGMTDDGAVAIVGSLQMGGGFFNVRGKQRGNRVQLLTTDPDDDSLALEGQVKGGRLGTNSSIKVTPDGATQVNR